MRVAAMEQCQSPLRQGWGGLRDIECWQKIYTLERMYEQFKEYIQNIVDDDCA
jgi:hypothetical protein